MKQVIDADLVVLKKKDFFLFVIHCKTYWTMKMLFLLFTMRRKLMHTVCISPCRIDLRMLYGIMHGIGTDVNLNLLIRFHNYIIIFLLILFCFTGYTMHWDRIYQKYKVLIFTGSTNRTFIHMCMVKILIWNWYIQVHF